MMEMPIIRLILKPFFNKNKNISSAPFRLTQQFTSVSLCIFALRDGT